MSEAPQAPKLLPDWLTRRPYTVLALLCLLLWTPGMLTLPPLDRDESRFAQASKQMLETGNFIDIRFGAVPRYKKPVGIYWLQAAATEIAGGGRLGRIWTYRLPSLLGAVAAVWLAYWCMTAFAGGEAAFLGAALLGMTLLVAAEASIATTDAVLLAATLGVQGFLLRVYASGSKASVRLALAGWAAMGIAVLVKGPIAPAVAATTLLGLSVWDRDWRWLKNLRPLTGVAVVLALVAPWALAIALKSHGSFYQQSLGQDFAAKLQGGQESHGFPPGYYLVLTTLSFWPAVLFLAPALGSAVMRRGEKAIRFLLVWIAINWVMFEAVPTKLPHYILPVYPALAMLAALWLLAPRQEAKGWQRALAALAALQFLLGAAAFAAALIVLPKLYGEGTTWWLIALAGLGGTAALAALITFLRGSQRFALAACVAAVLVFYPALTLGAAPRLEQLWVSPRAAAAVAALSRPGDPPPALAGYEEPSLVFLLGTETRLTDGYGAAEAGAEQGGLAVVEESERPAFQAHLAELEADASQVGSLTGFNYSRGRPVRIRIYRVEPVRDTEPPPSE
jgi:4-amino-4-deoxy-L-arabinose transferase-like glycosyltransferase